MRSNTLEKIQFNDNITAPITQEEQQFVADKTTGKTIDKADKEPVFPVPDTASSIDSFAVKKWGGKPDVLYPYHNADGAVMLYIARWHNDGDKIIRPLSYCNLGNGQFGWAIKGMGGVDNRPLYRLPEILNNPDKPVLICEGEKTADSAQRLFPDYICTTPMQGAQSANKTDWQPLQGRKIVIAPDCDDAGMQFADTVYDLVTAESVQMLATWKLGKGCFINGDWCEHTNIAEKYDLADAEEDGWTAERINRTPDLLEAYITTEALTAITKNHGEQYRVNGSGVYQWCVVERAKVKQPAINDWIWQCSYLIVKCRCRDGNSGNWGYLVELIDADGKRKECTLPADIINDPKPYIKTLLNLGLKMKPYAHATIASYIQSTTTKKRATDVYKVGWHTIDNKQVYVFPGKVYGSPKNPVLLDIKGGIQPEPFTVKGNLQQWNETIGKYLPQNHRLIVVSCIGLAATILGLQEEAENFGIHFKGGSSMGKTTALHVAKSVMGNKINPWRTTDNAAEGLAALHHHNLLMLDELSQVEGRAADQMIYMLGNGQGKARANRSGEARGIIDFKTLFLSTGEISLSEKIAECGKRTKAGQAVRMLEIEADAETGHGIFNSIHDQPSAAQLSDYLKQQATKHSGAVLDHFLTKLLKNPDNALLSIKAKQREWLDDHCEPDANGQVKRVARNMALIAATGEIAIEWGCFAALQQDAAMRAIAVLFYDWYNSNKADDPQEVTATIKALRQFLEQHGSSRFETWGGDSEEPHKTINRAGFRKPVGGAYQYYLFKGTFRTEICQGGDPVVIARTLADKGIFIKDKKHKTAPSTTIPNYGTDRMYHINPDFMKGSD